MFGVNTTGTLLNFCSGELIGVSIDFKGITFDKAISIQKQMTENIGLANSYSTSYTTNHLPDDSTGMKRQSWTWRSGENNLTFSYYNWEGKANAAIFLQDSKLVTKCIARSATTQVRP